MPSALTICLAQINPFVGDIESNISRIKEFRRQAAQENADIILFPELCLIGYPPEDLVYREGFRNAAEEALDHLASETVDGGPAMLVGSLDHVGNTLYNSMFLLCDGTIQHRQAKHALPNYGVFDEMRIFTSGAAPRPFTFRGVSIGLLICEDMWQPGLAQNLAAQGAEILLVTNASPYELDKPGARHHHAERCVEESGLPLIYVNQVGGQDELVFDGLSFALNAKGEEIIRLPDFKESLHTVRWEKSDQNWHCMAPYIADKSDDMTSVYRAMVLGLRDYVNKNGFKGVILGLSGGIDSALSAAVAVDALGEKKVHTVMMPSRYTSQESLVDAAECAALLSIKLDSIPITPALEAMTDMLEPAFAGTQADTTEENLQARLRGIILMAYSNKFGWMLLTTGNKSEMSVGYATLYGDMAGGFSVLKDVYKTRVFALSHWRNTCQAPGELGLLGPEGRVIPERIITKPPTAELRENQKDEDSLPPYDILDPILERLVEKQQSTEEIIAAGYEAQIVRRIARLLYLAEYKRRQSPPGVKITSMAFGRDRRYPITSGFHG